VSELYRELLFDLLSNIQMREGQTLIVALSYTYILPASTNSIHISTVASCRSEVFKYKKL